MFSTRFLLAKYAICCELLNKPREQPLGLFTAHYCIQNTLEYKVDNRQNYLKKWVVVIKNFLSV